MKKLICEPAVAVRSDHRSIAGATGLSWRGYVAVVPRARFATPPVDLVTLVVAEALKRKAQAEIQRDRLRDALYEMPAPDERQHERQQKRPSER
jgi:hypothetical protein